MLKKVNFILRRTNLAFNNIVHILYRFNDAEQVSAELAVYLGSIESTKQNLKNNFTLPPAYKSGIDLSNSGEWRPLGGVPGTNSWQPGFFTRARAITVWRNLLVVGLDGGKEGRAAIYAYNGKEWAQLGGNNINGSWRHGIEVNTVTVHDDKLFVGLSSEKFGPQIWAYDNERWQMVAPGNGAAWGPEHYFSVTSMISDGQRLLAGLSSKNVSRHTANSEDEYFSRISPVFEYQNGQWSKLGDGRTWGPDRIYECAYDMHRHSDGCVYLGFFGRYSNNGDVWKLTGQKFERIGGSGLNDSWDVSTNVLRLRSFGDDVVAVMNRQPMCPGDFSSVWIFRNGKWMPIGLGGIPHEWGWMNSFNALDVYKGRLIIGGGGRPAGKASTWFLDDNGAWQCFGGQGRRGSWSPYQFRRKYKPLSTRNGAEYVYQFAEYNGQLIVGFGSSPGAAQIWAYTP